MPALRTDATFGSAYGPSMAWLDDLADAHNVVVTSPAFFGVFCPARIANLSQCHRLRLAALSHDYTGLAASDDDSEPDRDDDDDNEPVLLSGLAAPYGQVSQPDPGSGERHMFSPGCFGACLSAPAERATLYNFDTRYVIGRERAGTATFYEKLDGLYFEACPPNTSWMRDLSVSIDRGDISGSAVACIPSRSHYDRQQGERIRAIDAATLITVSVASFTAFDRGVNIKRQPGRSTSASLTPLDRDLLNQMGIKGLLS